MPNHQNEGSVNEPLCLREGRLWPALWTFVDEEGVEPANNAAERARRPAILRRKGSFGTQSDGGARFAERLLTITPTGRQQGRSVLEYLNASALSPNSVNRSPPCYQSR